MRFGLVVVACALVLGGCQSKAEQASELAQQSDMLCRGGVGMAGGNSYENCRLTMMQKLLDLKSAEKIERDNRIADAGALAGAALLAPRPAAPRPLTCTSNTFAGMTTTNCN